MIKKIRKPWQPERPKTNESWAYDPRYHTTRWRNYRKSFIKSNPLCIECKKVGKLVPTQVIGHIIPVSEKPELFWEPTNHKALCQSCNLREVRR